MCAISSWVKTRAIFRIPPPLYTVRLNSNLENFLAIEHLRIDSLVAQPLLCVFSLEQADFDLAADLRDHLQAFELLVALFARYAFAHGGFLRFFFLRADGLGEAEHDFEQLAMRFERQLQLGVVAQLDDLLDALLP